MKRDYETLSEAMNDLQKRGYSEDLNLKSNCIECRNQQMEIMADEFMVDEVYRFEGDTNPDDSSILFAISSEKYKLKGVLVDAYGAYADPLTTDMIQKLRYSPS